MKKIFILSLMLLCLAGASATNRALLVGIGAYDRMKTGWSAIHGDKDVELLKPLLASKGFSDIFTLTNRQATKSAIVRALQNLAERTQPGDRVYFHFSGHGQPVRDDNHDEKDKKYDESIIPFDACRDNLKMNGQYEGQFHLIDDELAPLLNAIKRKAGPKGELFVVVDACYSKGIQKDEVTELDPDILKYARGTDQPFVPKPGSTYLANLNKPSAFSPGALLTVVTACGSDESNYEYRIDATHRYGSLSYYIYILLKKDADFSRWRECFLKEDYSGRKIFQPIQHPSIEIIE